MLNLNPEEQEVVWLKLLKLYVGYMCLWCTNCSLFNLNELAGTRGHHFKQWRRKKTVIFNQYAYFYRQRFKQLEQYAIQHCISRNRYKTPSKNLLENIGNTEYLVKLHTHCCHLADRCISRGSWTPILVHFKIHVKVTSKCCLTTTFGIVNALWVWLKK